MDQLSCVSGAASERRRVDGSEPRQAGTKRADCLVGRNKRHTQDHKEGITVLNNVGVVASLFVVPASLVDSSMVATLMKDLREQCNTGFLRNGSSSSTFEYPFDWHGNKSWVIKPSTISWILFIACFHTCLNVRIGLLFLLMPSKSV
jgi:hypothetical protein